MTRLLMSLGLLLLVTTPALAQETFSFQGKLTNPGGTPVTDGSYGIQFQLFDQPTGGSPLWGEAHTITTTEGVFSTVLGAKTTLNLEAFHSTPHLQLIVDGTALSPRTPLTAVPYAMTSYRLDEEALHAGDNVSIRRRTDGSLEIEATGGGGGTGGLTSVSTDGTMEGDGTSSSPLRLADGSVTGAKLANGALVAGQNVTVTRQAGGALEVSATGGGGLSQVASDATLAGDGTAGDPLALNIPLTLTHSGNAAVIAATSGNGNIARFASADQGIYGQNHNGHYGYLGGPSFGAYGEHSNGNFGQLGTSSFGVRGESTSGVGIRGFSASGTGVLGSSDSGFGVRGSSTSGAGIQGSSDSDYGVFGASNSGYGVYGTSASSISVFGEHNNGNIGSLGSTGFGAYGRHQGSNNWGALGTSSYAGYFQGDVHITGTLSKGGGSFKIDHPLDPANKYLAHSFVESPDMMNVYNGNAMLDAAGEAIVELPAYFEALNRDFRYQLTAIGAPGPNLYIAEKISGNTFKIAGGTPGMEVSWLVTGIRQDAWAEQNRIVVEEDKPADEHGFYLNPSVFGQPPERSVMWVKHPEAMRSIQGPPARLEEARRQIKTGREQQ
ncbi:MAG TPA: hypothetical protein VKP65_20010 [Rhodothermales bacterium]|nr:hypothetical protein [Rhodothermales bacterium]